MPTVLTALAVALVGPVALLGAAFPGFGTLPDDVPVPSGVAEAVAEAEVAPQTGGRVLFNDPSCTRAEQFARA